MDLKGSFVALVTPFKENFQLDLKALEELIFFHIENGTDGILCCGTTGESPTLSEKEKLKVIETCVKASNKKMPIIAGTGTYDTLKSLAMTKKALDLGVEGCLVVVPYYNRPMQVGIVKHFEEVSKANCPIILYHHPKRTGTFLTLETFEEISKIENVVAIKECSQNPSFVEQLIEKTNLPIFSGDDDLTLEIMKKGGVGSISVIANIIPKIWKNFISLCLEKEFQKAEALYEKQKELCEAISLETNPQCIKYAMSLLKKITSKIRLPLIEPEEKTKKVLENILN